MSNAAKIIDEDRNKSSNLFKRFATATNKIFTPKQISQITGFENIFICASWLLLNIGVYLSVVESQYFFDIKSSINYVYGVIFSFLATLLLGTFVTHLVKQVISDFKSGVLTIKLSALCVLLFSCGLSGYWLSKDAEYFFKDLNIDYLIFSCAAVSAYLHYRHTLFLALANKTGLRFDRVGKSAIKIGSANYVTEHELNTAKIEQDIYPGDLVQFSPQAIVSHDSFIVEGNLKVFEREFSGLGSWKHKQAGEHLYAGSYVLVGQAICRVESQPQDARITTLMPNGIGLIESSNAHSMLIGFCLFVACFAAIFWNDRGLDVEQILYIFGSFCALSFCADWFWLSKLPRIIQLQRLFFRGVILKSSKFLKNLANLKEVYLRIANHSHTNAPAIEAINVLDDRLDRQKLMAVLEALCGLSVDNQYLQVLSTHLHDSDKLFSEVVHLSDCCNYYTGDVSAEYQGVEFSLGTEEFLLARGVHVPTNIVKIKSQNEYRLIYLAMGDQLVATIKYCYKPLLTRRLLHKLQRQLNIKLHLSGAACDESLDQNQIDQLGKDLGIDLGYIKAKETDDELLTKLSSKTQVVLVDTTDRIPDLSDSILVVRNFNFLNFDPYANDISLIKSSWNHFLRGLNEIRYVNALQIIIKYVLPVMFLLALVMTFIGYIHPELMFAAVCSIIIMVAGLLYCSAINWKNTIVE